MANAANENDLGLEDCVVCLQQTKCLHVVRHGKCGPHPVCSECSYSLVSSFGASMLANGQFPCPICRRFLGSRRRAIAECMSPYSAVIDNRFAIVKRSRPSTDKSSDAQQEKRPRIEPRNLYKVLGAKHGATGAELQSAYRHKSLLVHPDKPGGSTAAFLEVVEAYEVLLDPVRRAEHDRALGVAAGTHAQRESRLPEPTMVDAEIISRAAALRGALLETNPKAWRRRLACVPASRPWSRPVLRILSERGNQKKQCHTKAPLLCDENPPEKKKCARGTCGTKQVGLASEVQRGCLVYRVRLVFKDLKISTKWSDRTTALVAHSTVLRLRSEANQLIREGRTFEEAVRVFEFTDVDFYFAFECVKYKKGTRIRKTTPQTRDLVSALSHWHRIMKRFETRDNVDDEASKLRNRFRRERAEAAATEHTLCALAQQELEVREYIENFQHRRRLRTKQPIPRKQARRSRLRKKQPPPPQRDSRPRIVPSVPSLDENPPSARTQLCALPRPASEGCSNVVEAPLALESGANSLARDLASEVISFLDAQTEAQTVPNLQMPWFKSACRAAGIQARNRAFILRRMQESVAVQKALQLAFCDAHAGLL
eukprot:TRINITY_DN48866_c0_g1_i1.p1 TRINITY_DN48866_c0_g1~~TRINITY_DN48866_c0_g1_i1.p1  ORF type:complete len:599 (+),score=63.36 TRINITY_DN48866_c0_g1_i1:39-1835(+)